MLRQALLTTNQAMTAVVPPICWPLFDLDYDVVFIECSTAAFPQAVDDSGNSHLVFFEVDSGCYPTLNPNA